MKISARRLGFESLLRLIFHKTEKRESPLFKSIQFFEFNSFDLTQNATLDKLLTSNVVSYRRLATTKKIAKQLLSFNLIFYEKKTLRLFGAEFFQLPLIKRIVGGKFAILCLKNLRPF